MVILTKKRFCCCCLFVLLSGSRVGRWPRRPATAAGKEGKGSTCVGVGWWCVVVVGL